MVAFLFVCVHPRMCQCVIQFAVLRCSLTVCVNVIPVLSMHRTDPDAFWEILSGAKYCEIVDGGRCVTDGSGDYGNSEVCIVKALQPLFVSAKEFLTAEEHDFVKINGIIEYSGDHGPQGVFMARGAIWRWQSDTSLTSAGFTLCASVSKGSTANIYKRAYQLSHNNTN